MRTKVSNLSHPSPFPGKTNILGWRVGVAFQEGRGPGEAAGGTPPGSLSWKTGCSQLLPRASHPPSQLLGMGIGGGGGMPACTALPFPPSSSPDTLRRPREKWLCLGLRVDEILPAAGRSLCGQPRRPPQRRNYLLAFFRVQVVEPLPWVLRSGRQSPPAAPRAPRLHAAAICGLSHSHPPRPESPSRGAGRSMELGAGPAGAA